MNDSYEIYNQLINQFNNLKESGRTVVISGESGIGKSYHSKRFLNCIENDAYIVRIVGFPIEQGAFNTINTAVYKNISNEIVNREITLNLLQKITYIIPRFGQYVSPFFDSNIKFTAFWNIIKNSSINSDEPNIYGIINFFEKLARKKDIVFYCDNVQWFDKKSWTMLINLITSVSKKRWLFVVNYTTNAEIIDLTHDEIIKTFHALEKSNECSFLHLEINRWSLEKLSELCSNIFNAKVNLSSSELELLYEYTKGLPLFVKTVLTLFKEYGYLIYKDFIWESNGNWKTESIKNILNDSIKERISNVYHSIPQSRETLELASVFGEEFKEEIINKIFDTKNSFDILTNIETKFKLIQYLTDERLWIFEHFIVQNYIYNSLGKNAKIMHLKIADYLVATKSENFLQIALHYFKSGNFEKSLYYKILETNQLLESGCYDSALCLF